MDRSIRKRRKDFERNKRRMGVQRSGRRRMDVLSGREKWISTIAGFQVFFLAWNLGSMHAWAQWVNLGLALLGFLGLLIPDATALPRQGLQGMARLFGSPVFWFGGLFLAYVGVQCTNHSWMYEVVIPDASIQEVAGEEGGPEAGRGHARGRRAGDVGRQDRQLGEGRHGAEAPDQRLGRGIPVSDHDLP